MAPVIGVRKQVSEMLNPAARDWSHALKLVSNSDHCSSGLDARFRLRGGFCGRGGSLWSWNFGTCSYSLSLVKNFDCVAKKYSYPSDNRLCFHLLKSKLG